MQYSLRAFIRKTDIAHGHRANRRVGVLGQRVASLLGALGAPGLAVRAAVGLRATLNVITGTTGHSAWR